MCAGSEGGNDEVDGSRDREADSHEHPANNRARQRRCARRPAELQAQLTMSGTAWLAVGAMEVSEKGRRRDQQCHA